MVGAAGLEPATFRPPAGCATRLRHAPRRGTIEHIEFYNVILTYSAKGRFSIEF